MQQALFLLDTCCVCAFISKVHLHRCHDSTKQLAISRHHATLHVDAETDLKRTKQLSTARVEHRVYAPSLDGNNAVDANIPHQHRARSRLHGKHRVDRGVNIHGCDWGCYHDALPLPARLWYSIH